MKKEVMILLIIIHSCFSFAQEVENTKTKYQYNILGFGAIGDGLTVNTAAIQKTINTCAEQGGGTVIIPPGNFVTGSLQLFSNVNLYFEAGAVLSGSLHNEDYLYQKDFGFSGSGAGNKTGIIFAQNARNISITGFGIIDGHGDHFVYADSLQYGMDFNPEFTRQGSGYMDPKYRREDGPVLWKGTYEERPGTMVVFSDCNHITVRDLSFKQSPNWTLHFLRCEDAKVNGITIENNMKIPNSDGIDIYDSKNITISDCIIHAGDDAIAVISSDNIAAENCILQSRSSGIRVGYNVFNNRNSENLLFNNIHIYDSNRGIGIFQRQQGDMKNMIFSNIIINTRLHSGPWWGHGEPIHISAVPGLGSKEVGSISNILFSNITATSESGIVIYGSEESIIKDVTFDNVRITIRRGRFSGSYGGNIDLRPVNNPASAIFKKDIPAVYACFVNNLVVRNLEVIWGEKLPEYFSNGLECTNFNTITIDGLSEHLADRPLNNLPVVYLHQGKNSKSENITTSEKSRKLIVMEDVRSEVK